MALKRKNKSLYIDQEAVAALQMLKAGLLSPVTELMNKSEVLDVLRFGM